MTNGERQFDLQDLQQAAVREEWEIVDANLSSFANDKQTIGWVRTEGLISDNPHLRDLAASVFQESSVKLTDEDIRKLREMMKIDANPYAQYRSAFALFTHGVRDEKVLNKIREGLNDPDVGEIAENYLEQVK